MNDPRLRLKAVTAEGVPTDGRRAIGLILVDLGKLRDADVDSVVTLQGRNRVRFGEAAIQLGLVQERDIHQALAVQFDNLPLPAGRPGLSQELVTLHQPTSDHAESFRALRTQILLQTQRDPVRGQAILIASPRPGEGRSYVAANLAVTFAQLGERTLLVDADMRRPRQHAMFNLGAEAGLSTLLVRRSASESIVTLPFLPNLSVLRAGPRPPNPLELATRPGFQDLMEYLRGHWDVVIVDSPPAREHTDAQMLAARLGGALLVARRNVTRMQELQQMKQAFTVAACTLHGIVMNEF